MFINSVFQFLTQSWIMPRVNSNLICLIPKYKEAAKIEYYRSIDFANFLLKTKIPLVEPLPLLWICLESANQPNRIVHYLIIKLDTRPDRGMNVITDWLVA
jgi:hypothetical protein